jgi:5-methylcytosine-specific restriction endonuclease McrA
VAVKQSAEVRKEKARVRASIWYYANRERAKSNARLYAAAHREETRQKARDYYAKNKERALAWQRAYKDADPERTRQMYREWRRRNREQAAALSRAYKARKKGAAGRHTGADIKRLFAQQGGECVYCRASLTSYHVDHIQPLVRGGSNDVSNLQLLCPTCNMSKRDKAHDAFLAYREKRETLWR